MDSQTGIISSTANSRQAGLHTAQRVRSSSQEAHTSRWHESVDPNVLAKSVPHHLPNHPDPQFKELALEIKRLGLKCSKRTENSTPLKIGALTNLLDFLKRVDQAPFIRQQIDSLSTYLAHNTADCNAIPSDPFRGVTSWNEDDWKDKEKKLIDDAIDDAIELGELRSRLALGSFRPSSLLCTSRLTYPVAGSKKFQGREARLGGQVNFERAGRNLRGMLGLLREELKRTELQAEKTKAYSREQLSWFYSVVPEGRVGLLTQPDTRLLEGFDFDIAMAPPSN
ncbi:hypothetical protein B0H13DRAFT_1856313 [Mycena leptocephala]|nr:hypothetical protein B0H13DRAFT_1856313 [Mycena leptocephala]